MNEPVFADKEPFIRCNNGNMVIDHMLRELDFIDSRSTRYTCSYCVATMNDESFVCFSVVKISVSLEESSRHELDAAHTHSTLLKRFVSSSV